MTIGRDRKRAVVLAGGLGTRLRPYTTVLPKPLMPVGEYPILEVVVRQLARSGFDWITMAVNHQAEIIQAFFGDGTKWGVTIDYSLEEVRLGTMAPLRLIKNLPENFLVMNGDILTDLNYAEFYDRHCRAGDVFTISAHRRQHKLDYGVLEADKASYLTGFKEKPVRDFLVSMGVYMVNKAALDFIPTEGAFGFDQLMLRLIEEQKKVRVDHFCGYWLDIGRPDDYEQAIEQFELHKLRFLNG